MSVKSEISPGDSANKHYSKHKCCGKGCDFIHNYIKPIMISLVVVFIFRTLCYEPFKVPTGSMKPTILEGDYLLVSKFSYGYGDFFLSSMYIPTKLNLGKRIFGTTPKRGDVIVFRSSNKDDSNNYVKRLIGLPGDSIRLSRGILYINNEPVKLISDGQYTGCDHLSQYFVCNKLLEQLPEGKTYKILDANHSFRLLFPDTTYTYHVPPRHYFFLGDNRNFSKDSRFEDGIGMVPEENLIGRTEFIYWNSNMSFKEIIQAVWSRVRFLRKL